MALRLSRSIVGEAEAEAVRKVIMEDGYLGMGSVTQKFEENIAFYLGVEPWQVICVNSGTAALHLAVQAIAMKVEKRDPSHQPEVLAPSLTFVASFQAISAAGCKPVACDVNPATGTLDLEDAARRITERTIGLMHVDYASNPWRLDEVYEFAARHNLEMIDDAAHAFGCRHHGRKIGSFGNLVCFSFDGIKNITSGEGGCVIAFNKENAEIIADSRLLGVRGDSVKRFAGKRSWDPDVAFQGWRYHLSNIMAAIGCVQLERLESEFIPARRHLYKLYASLLAPCENVRLFKTDPEDFIVPHILPVRILNGKRANALQEFDRLGIPAGMHYKPNHLLQLFGGGSVKLPNVELLFEQLMTLPLHPGLSDEDVRFVCDSLIKAVL